MGLGKTHLAIALGYAACQEGATVLFTPAVEMLNALIAAQAAHRLKCELQRFRKPRLLIIDELGYLPIDKQGADLLFQVFSQRYENGATLLTTNKPFKQWPAIFNNELLAKVFSSRLRTHPPLRVPLQGGDHNSLSRNLLGSPPMEGWPKAGVHQMEAIGFGTLTGWAARPVISATAACHPGVLAETRQIQNCNFVSRPTLRITVSSPSRAKNTVNLLA